MLGGWISPEGHRQFSSQGRNAAAEGRDVRDERRPQGIRQQQITSGRPRARRMRSDRLGGIPDVRSTSLQEFVVHRFRRGDIGRRHRPGRPRWSRRRGWWRRWRPWRKRRGRRWKCTLVRWRRWGRRRPFVLRRRRRRRWFVHAFFARRGRRRRRQQSVDALFAQWWWWRRWQLDEKFLRRLAFRPVEELVRRRWWRR
jgi:hypothetical protein